MTLISPFGSKKSRAYKALQLTADSATGSRMSNESLLNK